MEFISANDDYQHPYLHHRNVLNPYTSPYAHRDFLGEDVDFGQDDEPYCPDDEETGQTRAIMDKDEENDEDYISSSSYQKGYKGDDEEGDIPSSSYPKRFNKQQEEGEEYPCGEDNEEKYSEEGQQGRQEEGRSSTDDYNYNPKTDGKKSAPGEGGVGGASTLEEKLTGRLDQLKAVFMKRLNKASEFCSWNCFFSLLFVVGVLLVFLDHYGSAYVRMMNMQKFFFFVMGVLTTTVAVVVVCVVVAFTSCYGDGI